MPLRHIIVIALLGMSSASSPARAEDSYSDGYSAAVQNMTSEPPESTSNAYYGYRDAEEDMRNDYYDRHPAETAPEPPSFDPTPYSASSNSSYGASNGGE